MKQDETKRVEVYYEQIQKLAHGLQVPTTNNFLIAMFRPGLRSNLRIVTAGMKWSTLQQHIKAAMLCEEGMTITKVRSALLVRHNAKHATPSKTQSNTGKINKHCTNYGMKNHNVETCKKKKKQTIMATTNATQLS